MARRASKHTRAPRPLVIGAAETTARKRDGVWVTRPVSAARALKAYTCPGCHRRVEEGTAHIVAWPSVPALGSSSAVDERRHWHTACWQSRE